MFFMFIMLGAEAFSVFLEAHPPHIIYLLLQVLVDNADFLKELELV